MRELSHSALRRVKDFAPVRRRRQVLALRFGVRTLTARRRALPDMLIVGAQRCGTSSLYKLLGRHPQVVASLRKEVEYFSTSFHEGLDWYRTHFPLVVRLKLSERLHGQAPLTFEATPDYMLDPRAPHRAAALLPDLRILALVRNPVDRAFSQFLHNRRLGHEPLTFDEAIDAESKRLDGEFERLSDDVTYVARSLRRYSYVTRGLYADQIERWAECFGWDRILVVRSEDLFAAPAQTYASITSFLGLSEWSPRHFPNYSYGSSGVPGRETGSDDEMRRSTRVRLQETFAPHNQRLAELLGRDLGWDDSPDHVGGSPPREHPSPAL